MSHWWRAYNDAINDPKLLRLSDELFRAWFTLMCIASKNQGKLPPASDIALVLRMKPAKVAEWITRLATAGLIDNFDGVFSPHNWNSRQFKSDVSTDRVQRFRNKQRNVSSTVSETPPEQSRYRADTEQSRADAPRAELNEDLERKAAALGAGVAAMFASRGQTVPDLGRCSHWLTEGYSQGTILAAVEAVLRRGKTISSLEYFDGAIRDQHAKAAQPSPDLQVVSSKVIVVEGTLEHTCWNQYRKEKGQRPLFICRQAGPENTIVMGALCDSLFPPGYDEATGERIPDKAEDAA